MTTTKKKMPRERHVTKVKSSTVGRRLIISLLTNSERSTVVLETLFRERIENKIKAQAEEDNSYQIQEWLTALCIPATIICIDMSCLYVLSASFLFYLKLLEEFYHKGKHRITMSEDLPETFECCAQVLRQNLLSYQSQIDDYYNSCLKEFWDQLKLFEEELPYVSQLAIDGLLKEHEQKLSYDTSNIQHSFNQQLEEWRRVKAEHENELRPFLGHPENFLQLEALCQREAKERKDHLDAIQLHTQMLRDCTAQCAQNFVSALAAFTEKLLLELDESITIDDIHLPNHLPETGTQIEKTSSLIHHKQAGLPLQTHGAEQLVERGSR
ncbi:hypothetical protein ASZ78_009549 [Callipepla squamata]|uniref:DUF4456 domain-containing protein n=1 Tax=Callipepla squamata TaxID=9009 RepID=A0A226NMT7_CALSU|nr:hypothetical protein ASZ78_009549 [Callipepla squamata]